MGLPLITLIIMLRALDNAIGCCSVNGDTVAFLLLCQLCQLVPSMFEHPVIYWLFGADVVEKWLCVTDRWIFPIIVSQRDLLSVQMKMVIPMLLTLLFYHVSDAWGAVFFFYEWSYESFSSFFCGNKVRDVYMTLCYYDCKASIFWSTSRWTISAHNEICLNAVDLFKTLSRFNLDIIQLTGYSWGRTYVVVSVGVWYISWTNNEQITCLMLQLRASGSTLNS